MISVRSPDLGYERVLLSGVVEHLVDGAKGRLGGGVYREVRREELAVAHVMLSTSYCRASDFGIQQHQLRACPTPFPCTILSASDLHTATVSLRKLAPPVHIPHVPKTQPCGSGSHLLSCHFSHSPFVMCMVGGPSGQLVASCEQWLIWEEQSEGKPIDTTDPLMSHAWRK